MHRDYFSHVHTTVPLDQVKSYKKKSKMAVHSTDYVCSVDTHSVTSELIDMHQRECPENRGVLAFSCKRLNLVMRGVILAASSQVQILCYKTTIGRITGSSG